MGVTVSQITGNLAACWTACSSWQQTNLYQYFNPLGTHDTTTTKQSTTKPSIHILYRSSDIWQVCLAGLVQEWIISSALAMEILRSCTDSGGFELTTFWFKVQYHHQHLIDWYLLLGLKSSLNIKMARVNTHKLWCFRVLLCACAYTHVTQRWLVCWFQGAIKAPLDSTGKITWKSML